MALAFFNPLRLLAGPALASCPPRRPQALRVLRMVESNARPASAGRMVISGRMADVCAELDRLAARAAQQEQQALRARSTP